MQKIIDEKQRKPNTKQWKTQQKTGRKAENPWKTQRKVK